MSFTKPSCNKVFYTTIAVIPEYLRARLSSEALVVHGIQSVPHGRERQDYIDLLNGCQLQLVGIERKRKLKMLRDDDSEVNIGRGRGRGRGRKKNLAIDSIEFPIWKPPFVD